MVLTKYFILGHRSIQNIIIVESIYLLLFVERTVRTKRNKENILLFLLLSWIFMVLVSTVLARIYWQVWIMKPIEWDRIKWIPFYSYAEIYSGNQLYLQQVLMNYMMLLPVGFLLPAISKRFHFSICMKICFCISVCIELLQLIYSCGMCEIDDIIHNTFGGCIGYWIYRLCHLLLLKIKHEIHVPLV